MTAVGEVGEDPAPPGRLAAPRVPAGSAEDRKPMPRNLALGRGADQLAKRDIPPAGTNAALRKLHVVRLRLEQVGGKRPQLLAQLERRLDHGVARHVQLPRRRRRPSQRRERGIADVDDDIRRVDAEHFARQLHER